MRIAQNGEVFARYYPPYVATTDFVVDLVILRFVSRWQNQPPAATGGLRLVSCIPKTNLPASGFGIQSGEASQSPPQFFVFPLAIPHKFVYNVI